MLFQKGNKWAFKKGRTPWNKGKKGLQVAWNKEMKGFKHSGSFKKGHQLNKGNQYAKGNPPNRTSFKKGQTRGKNNIRWKDGRSKHEGYILILKPEHPFADKNGYVREHRLVCEKILGRYLKPNEIVHHINEIKDDNRPENLYLFPSNKSHIAYHILIKSGLGLIKPITKSNLTHNL